MNAIRLNHHRVEELIYEITQKVNKDSNSDKPMERLPLIKINDSEKLSKLIKFGNEALRTILKEHPTDYNDLTSLNKVIHATGKTV